MFFFLCDLGDLYCSLYRMMIKEPLLKCISSFTTSSSQMTKKDPSDDSCREAFVVGFIYSSYCRRRDKGFVYNIRFYVRLFF